MKPTRDSRSGAVLVFFILFLGVMISIIALVVDLGILEATIRSIQHTADAASVGAATALSVDDADSAGATGEATRFANVKKTVLMIVSESEIMRLDDTARAALTNQTLTFNHSTGDNATGPDWPNYRYDTAQAGNLTVRVRRQLRCFTGSDASPNRITYELDDVPNSAFCRANQVTVDITLSNVKTFFGGFMGMPTFSSITRSSSSFMHERLPDSAAAICESTNCSALGMDFGDLSAATNCLGSATPAP